MCQPWQVLGVLGHLEEFHLLLPPFPTPLPTCIGLWDSAFLGVPLVNLDQQ